MSTINVLHITAHLGGGVGKVLSRLIEESTRSRDGIQHTIATLEAPEKTQFSDYVQAHGGKLLICPPPDELNRLAAIADIVQLEWWHHPAVAAWLCTENLPEMRLIVWSHVSGLHPPLILPGFVQAPHRFLFSSPCSYEHPALKQIPSEAMQRTGVVFSSGGFGDFPEPPRHSNNKQLQVGYVGTLNFAKLHPQLIEYLAAVDLPAFRLAMIGDPTSGNELHAQAKALGMTDRLELRGYCTNIADNLAGFDVFAYLLNPLHYGTTENALLEAMAMGVVPIALDNPAERQLIRHGQTGLLVKNPKGFADALNWLADHPDKRLLISMNAAREVRDRFNVTNTCESLNIHYTNVATEKKKRFDFRSIFGTEPSDWFLSCQDAEIQRFLSASPIELCTKPLSHHYLYEESKGSVFHYQRHFKNDLRLKTWSDNLKRQKIASRHVFSTPDTL